MPTSPMTAPIISRVTPVDSDVLRATNAEADDRGAEAHQHDGGPQQLGCLVQILVKRPVPDDAVTGLIGGDTSSWLGVLSWHGFS